MDDLSASLPQLGAILAFAVGGTVFLIQKAKMLVLKHSKSAKKKVPAWVWLGASIVIPFGIVVIALQPWMQSWLNAFLPSSLRLVTAPSDIVATGLSAVIGTGGAYATAKKLGLAADYSPGGPNDVSTPPTETPMSEPAPVVAPEAPVVPVAPTEAEAPTPQPDTQEACTMDAAILFRADGSPAYVELSSPSGKWRVVRINT